MADRYGAVFDACKNCKRDVPMGDYTSYRCGGKADVLAEPGSAEELQRLVAVLREQSIPYYVIGNGSNVLVKDGGYPGVIIYLGSAFSAIEFQGDTLRAGAGAMLSTAAKSACEKGFTGMEFATGIPGSVGGGVYMNAGAYDGEIAVMLMESEILEVATGTIKTVPAAALELSYRHSALMESGDIVLSATFQLTKGNQEKIDAKVADFTERRTTKQPLQYPSCGSFFKRPVGHFAGGLIEQAGLKGLTCGGARVSELHAGFLINYDNATATDIITLMHLVQAAVLADSGVTLEPEVRIIGNDVETDI